MTEHVEIQDPEIHEPKGVSSASSGTVYVADGLGSGDWTSYSNWTGYPAYGGLKLNDANTVAMTNIGTTAQQLTVFTTETMPSSGVTAGEDILTIVTDGVYQINFNACFKTAAAGDAGIYQFRLRIDGSEPASPKNLGARKELSGSSDTGTISFTGLVTLAEDDILSIWVESDEAGDTDDLDFYDAQFTAVLVGTV